MLNLQLLQRQRARIYKNDLRRQFQQKQQMRKNQSMELKSRDQEELKEKMEIAQKQQRYERERDFYLNAKLKEDNMMLASLKNMDREVQQSVKEQVPIKGHSLLQTLYKHEQHRGSQNKHVAYKLREQNHKQQNLHKMTSKQIRDYELQQDQKHMERLKQIQIVRKQQYEDIKNRHSPQPKVGQIHKRLQDMNEEYRRSLQSFAYNGRDILDVLKRDDSRQIFDRNRKVQSEIKNQMEEKKLKDQISKQQYIGQPDDLKKSILGSVLFKGPNYDKKEYGNFLMKQINQTDFKKSTQKIQNKQKVQVGSIFGGQGGPQRLKMIKYIDQNLGIQSEYLKNIDPGKTSSSAYRIKNLYSGEQIHNNTIGIINKSRIQTHTPQAHMNQTQNPQKLHTEIPQKHQQNKQKPQSSNQHTIRLSSSRVGNNQSSPKSYLGYDLIKGAQYRYEI